MTATSPSTDAALAALVRVLFRDLGTPGWLYRDEATVEKAMRHEAGMRHATDIVVGREGRVLVVVGELVTLTEGRGAKVLVSNGTAAGDYALSVDASFQGVAPGVTATDVIAACFSTTTAVVTAHRDGSVRRGRERIADVPGVRAMRTSSSSGTLAIAAEHDGVSAVHLFDREHARVASLEGGPLVGGVAWSPDGERFVRRTSQGLAIHDATGALCEEHALPAGSIGHVAWNAHGLFALTDEALAHVDTHGALHLVSSDGAPFVTLAAMHEGPFVAVATSAANGGLGLYDTRSHALCRVPWATRLLPWTPLRFARADRALLWADVAGIVVAVPFGEVPLDAHGLAADPQHDFVQTMSRELATNPDDARLRAMAEELRATTLRPSLASSASSLASIIDTRLRQHMAAAARPRMDKPAAIAPFAVGARVAHAKFGEGPVTAVEGEGDAAKITVAFEGGPKTLKASFLRAV